MKYVSFKKTVEWSVSVSVSLLCVYKKSLFPWYEIIIACWILSRFINRIDTYRIDTFMCTQYVSEFWITLEAHFNDFNWSSSWFSTFSPHSQKWMILEFQFGIFIRTPFVRNAWRIESMHFVFKPGGNLPSTAHEIFKAKKFINMFIYLMGNR